MERKFNNALVMEQCTEHEDVCDLEALLHPAQAFEHPSDVVNDPDLTLNEKRAILASWASDACALEAAPTLRYIPGGKQPVHFDEVMDALRDLDREARETDGHRPRYRRVLRRRDRPTRQRNGPDSDQGRSLS
jgi:hypothetical protein